MKKFLFSTIMLLTAICANAQVENYLQYTPTVANFALGACGVHPKHNLKDRLFVSAVSWGITYGVTGVLKHEIKEERPDHSDMKSFPSGHAARVFCGATTLMNEYYDVSPWIGITGFAVATTTAVLRVTGDHHYTHDVIIGSAIGAASAECGYLLLPIWQKLTSKWCKSSSTTSSKNDISLVVVPSLGTEQNGIAGSLTF